MVEFSWDGGESMKALFFDLDNTLLDRDESVKSFIDDQYERLRSHVGHILKEEYTTRFLELDQFGYVWKDKVYKQLVEEYRIQGITWEELLQDYLSSFRNHCLSFNHLHAVLIELTNKGYKLGMISNGFSDFQRGNIRALKIEKYFHSIIISEDLGIKKPDLTIFLKGLEEVGVAAEESFFVGDHPVNDIEAPKKLGFKTIWKKNKHFHDVKSDYIIEDLSEIIHILHKKEV